MLVVGDIAETAEIVPQDSVISLMLLDADGHIDRDFALFLNRLIPGGAIIIDDCADRVKLRRLRRGSFAVDAKMRLSYRLIDYFKRKGAVSGGELIGDTYFGHKKCGPGFAVNADEVLTIYRTMTYTHAETISTGRQSAIRAIGAVSPLLLNHLRAVYRGNPG